MYSQVRRQIDEPCITINNDWVEPAAKQCTRACIGLRPPTHSSTIISSSYSSCSRLTTCLRLQVPLFISLLKFHARTNLCGIVYVYGRYQSNLLFTTNCHVSWMSHIYDVASILSKTSFNFSGCCDQEHIKVGTQSPAGRMDVGWMSHIYFFLLVAFILQISFYISLAFLKFLQYAHFSYLRNAFCSFACIPLHSAVYQWN